ncbi:hypothetical protein BAUCODRAFT_124655 [Baudoinia panamericana UAMH 10762]|uniref:Large ribosomal subunit protein bL27m n=1 Tax=Baudoinia panamericana (strain UAMH 10762) TaxID=717646 RepID=M2MBM1_BAUPA|nr:uncharacterized protein BAUCODRAFT_124655 [Baudoinia panamericana UAMH 10762]EMC93906.1 hypothetical protein BAUCODRAFT_124655 [Baudoinia panamericana UAMH 10762]
MAALACLESALAGLRLSRQHLALLPLTSRRNASHQAQGRANGAKDGAGKRLGAKKTGGEYVVPGNILFRQRGTHWFPGENCFMGRDHTIHAGAPGYVRYYRDPTRHPKRKYIGIALEKHYDLPTPYNAARRRLLGMLAYQSPQTAPEQITNISDLTSTEDPTTIRQQPNSAREAITLKPTKSNPLGQKLSLKPGYQYRLSNWEIGRLPERQEAAARAKGMTTQERLPSGRSAKRPRY